MKICVNTISKNEIKFVDKFMESCDGLMKLLWEILAQPMERLRS
jgi:hypothetical protein